MPGVGWGDRGLPLQRRLLNRKAPHKTGSLFYEFLKIQGLGIAYSTS